MVMWLQLTNMSWRYYADDVHDDDAPEDDVHDDDDDADDVHSDDNDDADDVHLTGLPPAAMYSSRMRTLPVHLNGSVPFS